jgi:DNA-binding transcriptional LysR family regulator
MADRPSPLPNLGIQHLEYLRAVLAAPTWAQAAADVGVTPSALSQGIRELERRLGVTLFERSGRRQVLRPQAAEVAAYADRVLAQTRDLARWADEARSGRAGRVRLGLIDAAAVHHFPDALRAFRDERPDVDLHLVVAPSGALLGDLERGELDLAVGVRPPVERPGLVLTPLAIEPLFVYAPDGRAGAPPPTWGPWVTFPAGSHTRELLARALRACGASFEVVAESHQPDVLREMVRLGLGWAVLPADRAEAVAPGPSRARDEPLLHRELVAARRLDAVVNPAADAVLTVLCDAARP